MVLFQRAVALMELYIGNNQLSNIREVFYLPHIYMVLFQRAVALMELYIGNNQLSNIREVLSASHIYGSVPACRCFDGVIHRQQPAE